MYCFLFDFSKIEDHSLLANSLKLDQKFNFTIREYHNKIAINKGKKKTK